VALARTQRRHAAAAALNTPRGDRPVDGCHDDTKAALPQAAQLLEVAAVAGQSCSRCCCIAASATTTTLLLLLLLADGCGGCHCCCGGCGST
jgi:hypothetical protein